MSTSSNPLSNPDAFALAWREPMIRCARGYLGDESAAEDAAHEILVKALGAELPPDRVKPWLYRIARNHCLNLLRSKLQEPEPLLTSMHQDLGASYTGHLTRLVQAERRASLEQRLGELSLDQREILQLRYGDGLSRLEIAEVLGTSDAVAKSRLFEAMQKLRQLAGDLA